MSEMPSAEELIALEDQQRERLFKLGVVVDLFSNQTAKITFDGEDAASEKQYSYLASYSPAVGDRVILAAVAGTHVILGKVKYNSAPDAGGSTFDTLTTIGKATLNSLEVVNDADFKKSLIVRSNFQHLGGYLGFFNTQVTTRKSCANLATGAALATVVSKVNELLGYLRNYGLIS